MILMLGSISGMSHDLMVHLAIHHQGPLERKMFRQLWGSFALDGGSRSFRSNGVGRSGQQMRPVLYWPNGSIRWMLVDAILGVTHPKWALFNSLPESRHQFPPIGESRLSWKCTAVR